MNIESDILNERTLSSFLTFEFKNLLINEFKYSVSIAIAEFKVEATKYLVLPLKTLEFEVNQKLHLALKSNVYVDTYLNVDNLYLAGENHLFIEYKLSNQFDFTKLAEDFLKYKIYSYFNESKSIFAFVIMKKEKDWPTILTTHKTKPYVIIPRIISRSMFSPDDQIFIYLPNKGNEDLFDKTEDNEKIIKQTDALKTLIAINKVSEDFDLINIKKSEEIINSPFYDNIGLLKSRVSTAKILTRAYDEMLMLIKDCSKIKEARWWFNKYEEEYSNNETQAGLFKELKSHFLRFEKRFRKGDRTIAVNRGLRANHLTSLNVIVILKTFAKVFNLEFNPKIEILTPRDTPDEPIDYNKISDDLAEETIAYYGASSENKNKITKLATGLLFYLSNLYKLILIKSKDGVYDFNDDYNNINKTKKIQELLNELCKILGIPKIKIREENFRGNSLNIFESIVGL